MGWLFAVGRGESFPLRRQGWGVTGLCNAAKGVGGLSSARREKGGEWDSQRQGGVADGMTRFTAFLSRSGKAF